MLKFEEFTEDCVLSTELNYEASGLNFNAENNFDDKSVNIRLDGKASELSVVDSEYSKMLPNFEEIFEGAIKKMDANFRVNFQGYSIDIHWDEDIEFSPKNFSNFLEELNNNIKEKINNVLGDDLKNFVQRKRDEREEELACERENLIRKKVYESLFNDHPSECKLLTEAKWLPLHYDKTVEDSATSSGLFSLSREKVLREEQIDVIENSNLFEGLIYPQKNNETLVNIIPSKKGMDVFNEACEKATKEVYEEIIPASKDKKRMKLRS